MYATERIQQACGTWQSIIGHVESAIFGEMMRSFPTTYSIQPTV